jgi:hypothetical protein
MSVYFKRVSCLSYGLKVHFLDSIADVDLTFCNLGNPPDTMNFSLDTGASFSLGHIDHYSPDIGISSYTCECKIIKAKRGATIGVHVDATETALYERMLLTNILPYDGFISVPENNIEQPFTIGFAPAPVNWIVESHIL